MAFDIEGLCRRHQREVWCYLRTLGCDAQTADDLTQETFLAVLRKPFDVREPRATRAYLRKAARNQMRMAIRRRKARPAVHDPDAVDAAVAEAFDGGDERIDALVECIAKLQGRTREVVEERFRAGRSSLQVAERLGISRANVDTIVHRAKTTLKRCVEERLGRG